VKFNRELRTPHKSSICLKAIPPSNVPKGFINFWYLCFRAYLNAFVLFSGHYVCDLYDFHSQEWVRYDDADCRITDFASVAQSAEKNGYIFFYINRLD